MLIKQLQTLLTKRYKINAAIAMETASQLMNDKLWDFKNMSENEAAETLTLIEQGD